MQDGMDARRRCRYQRRLMPWYFYLAAMPAVILVGLSKGGFSGLSLLSIPLLALVTSPIRAAAIMLPILIVQDVVSVWAYRRSFNGRIVAIMIPRRHFGNCAGCDYRGLCDRRDRRARRRRHRLGLRALYLATPKRLARDATHRLGFERRILGRLLRLPQLDRQCRWPAVSGPCPAAAALAPRLCRHDDHGVCGNQLDEGRRLLCDRAGLVRKFPDFRDAVPAGDRCHYGRHLAGAARFGPAVLPDHLCVHDSRRPEADLRRHP